MTQEEKIQRIKLLSLTPINRIFDTYRGIHLMFGNMENHYSWFPGPGEIKLSVMFEDDKENITIDSNSLKNANFDEASTFQHVLRRVLFVARLIKHELSKS